MSRKMDWAEKRAKKIADALGVDSDRKAERALIAAELEIAWGNGFSEGMADKAWHENNPEDTDAN